MPERRSIVAGILHNSQSYFSLFTSLSHLAMPYYLVTRS